LKTLPDTLHAPGSRSEVVRRLLSVASRATGLPVAVRLAGEPEWEIEATPYTPEHWVRAARDLLASAGPLLDSAVAPADFGEEPGAAAIIVQAAARETLGVGSLVVVPIMGAS
jgi:hypothetical protein